MEYIRDQIDIFYGSVPTVLSDCIRGFFVSKPGHDFIACDFASIESRVLAWLAGDETKLEIFRTHGKVYEFNASQIYHVPLKDVTSDQRQIGKVSELSLGFGGGKGAFQRMAKNYGVTVTDERAEEIKVAWRLAHPGITRFWRNLNECALYAVKNPGKLAQVKTKYTTIKYKMNGSFLWCQLPSKRVLCYPYPEVRVLEKPFKHEAVTYMGEDSFSRKWVRIGTYGGKLAENCTQAVAREPLVRGMLNLEEKNYPVVLHIHDEIVCEVQEGCGSVAEMSQIMCELPEWAAGLPIAAEGWRGKRYKKH